MKQALFSRTVAALAVMGACACLPAAAAVSGPQAFSDLLSNTSVNGPGYYTSATRGVFVAGSTHVWVPSDNVQLISIAPPEVSAGCGGISMFFGGFSFINGAKLQQLVENIMQNALGYAIQLGIRVLCPMCSDILSQLQKMAQSAAQSSANSCQMAQGLVNTAFKASGLNPSSQGVSDVCANQSSSNGSSSDFADAMTSLCQGANNAASWIDRNIASLTSSSSDKGSQAAAKVAAQVGNTRWAALTLAGYSDTYVKEMILSAAGFSAYTKPPGSSKYAMHTFPGWSAVPEAQGKILVDLLIFGADPAQTKALLQKNNPQLEQALDQQLDDAEALHYGDKPFAVCRGISGSSLVSPPADTPAKGQASGVPYLRLCDTTDPAYPTISAVASSGQNPLVTPTGLLGYVGQTLSDAVNAVESGDQISPAAIELMQITPLPVYRMVNIAAVYPGVAQQLVSNYSYFISYLIAQSVIQQWLNTPTGVVPNIGAGNAGPAMNKTLGQIMNALNASVKGVSKDISQSLTTQDAILASLQQINDVMYQSLAGTGIQGNLMFTQGLAAGMSQGH